MSTPTPSQSDGGEENRVRCLYCGANNFPSSPICWQCGRPLQPIRSQSQSMAGGGQVLSPLPPLSGASHSAVAAPQNPALAPKAAAAMGLLFPYLGIPIGMVFLMLDEPRKTQIGWIMIGWSVAGSVLNAVFFFATLAPTLALLKAFIPHPPHGGMPGLPLPGGDSGGLNILIPFIYQCFACLF